MKIGLLICTYNRPEYLKECLDSVYRANLNDVDHCVIIDDHSDNIDTLNILKDKHWFLNVGPKGIKGSLMTGCNYLFSLGCDVIINLDGDAIVRNDFVEKLLEVWLEYPHTIVTGFHSTTKNKDGSERHRIINEYPIAYKKESVGGINLCFSRTEYEKYIFPAPAADHRRPGYGMQKICGRYQSGCINGSRFLENGEQCALLQLGVL